jgi:4-amino-4-deoxy-L-arabinose transferase-like glycosyltransferase
MLIKGPVAVVLPVAAFLVYLTALGELRRLREMQLASGAIIVLMIAVPWYVALYAQHGWTYITQFFLDENVDRYLSPVGPNDARGPLFYLPVLVTDMFPWSFALLGASVWWWRHRHSRRASADGSGDTAWRIATLLLSWCATFVVFFSFSRSKQDLYILPVAPAVVGLGGWFIHQMVIQPNAWRRWFLGTFSALGITLVAVGSLVVVVFVKTGPAYPLEGSIAVGSLAIAGGVLVTLLAWRDERAVAVIAGAATLVIINWLLAVQVLPAFERYKPIAPLSAAIERRLLPDDIVAHFDLALPSMTYYLRRHVEVTSDREALQGILRSGKRVFGVMPASRYEELRADFAPDTCVIARHATADVKLRNVLAGIAPPEVIVVLTPCPSS